MNKSMRKTILITAILTIILIVVNIFAFTAGDLFENIFIDLKLEDMQVEIEVMQDGSIFVKEKHFAKFSSKDDDWFNYYKVISSEGSYGRIDLNTLSIKVDGVVYPFKGNEIDLDDTFSNDRYTHVNETYYCRRPQGVELGVIMPEFRKGRKTIEFSYKLENIVTRADDVAFLYYKFISDNNPLPIDKFSATVTFPKSSDEFLRTWLHIDGAKGNVEIVGNDSIQIVAKDIPKETFVETRTTFDKDNFIYASRVSATTFEAIKAEEQSWYNESVAKAKKQLLFMGLDIFIGVAVLAVCLFFSIRDYMRRKRVSIIDSPIYIHEPPKDYSMEEAMALFYYYDNDESDTWWSDVISGTIMNLVRKGYLKITPGIKKKEAILSIDHDREDWDKLKPYENTIIDLLNDASINGIIEMKEFEKWCSKNYTDVERRLKDYKAECNQKAYSSRLYTVANPKIRPTGLIVAIVGICMSLLVIFAYNPFYVANITVGVSGIIMYLLDRLRSKPLNKAGERKYLELKAFEKYMLDFSNFDKKEIPELTLWEEYMVWATGMGIADEVSKQLSIAYPDFNKYYNADFDTMDTFVYWYLFAPRFRFNVGNISRGMSSTLSSVKAMQIADAASKHIGGGSGSGFGGGSFSGGGGGFGGGSMGGR